MTDQSPTTERRETLEATIDSAGLMHNTAHKNAGVGRVAATHRPPTERCEDQACESEIGMLQRLVATGEPHTLTAWQLRGVFAKIIRDRRECNDEADRIRGEKIEYVDKCVRLETELTTLLARVAAGEQDAALARFGAVVLTEFAQHDERGDLEGDWLQEKAVECGVMDEVKRTTPCGEDCVCAEFYEKGEEATCYPVRDWERVQQLAAAQRAAGGV